MKRGRLTADELSQGCDQRAGGLQAWSIQVSVPGPRSDKHEEFGIFQARILEWVAMPFSRGSSKPRDQTLVSYVSCIGRRVLCH